MSVWLLAGAGCVEDEPPVPAVPANEVRATALSASQDPAREVINVSPARADVSVVQAPVLPLSVSASEPLADVIKLAQAGVSEEVLLAFINNSQRIIDVSPDDIVYLTDLGVSSRVISTLIETGSSPEMSARRQSLSLAVSPAPDLVATSPVANIYPHEMSRSGQSFAQPSGPEATSSAPPADLVPGYGAVEPAAPAATVSYFYDTLAPYGTWIAVGDHGLCWQPTTVLADPHWRPYHDRGRWVYSNYGWYWHSDYSWGWAPFHYGRWFRHAHHGWVWAPGSVWAPAWVSWRYSTDYCGWAPLPPTAHYVSGVGFSYYGSSVGSHFEFGLGAAHYTYVPIARFCDYSPYRYAVAPHHVTRIHNQTIVNNNIIIGDNNTIINKGIPRERVAEVSRTEIRKVEVRDLDPGPSKQIDTVKLDRLEKVDNTLVVHRPKLSPQVVAKSSTDLERGREPTRPDRSGTPTKPLPVPVPPERISPAVAAPGTSSDPARISVRRTAESLVIKNESPRAVAPGPARPAWNAPSHDAGIADKKSGEVHAPLATATEERSARRPTYVPEPPITTVQDRAVTVPVHRSAPVSRPAPSGYSTRVEPVQPLPESRGKSSVVDHRYVQPVIPPQQPRVQPVIPPAETPRPVMAPQEVRRPGIPSVRVPDALPAYPQSRPVTVPAPARAERPDPGVGRVRVSPSAVPSPVYSPPPSPVVRERPSTPVPARPPVMVEPPSHLHSPVVTPSAPQPGRSSIRPEPILPGQGKESRGPRDR